jgi:hypothetical protein
VASVGIPLGAMVPGGVGSGHRLRRPSLVGGERPLPKFFQAQGSVNRPLLARASNLYYKGKGHNP